jgi:hypothetical protein
LTGPPGGDEKNEEAHEAEEGKLAVALRARAHHIESDPRRGPSLVLVAQPSVSYHSDGSTDAVVFCCPKRLS